MIPAAVQPAEFPSPPAEGNGGPREGHDVPRGESPPECGVAQVIRASPSANPVGVMTERGSPECRSTYVLFFVVRSRAASPCSARPLALGGGEAVAGTRRRARARQRQGREHARVGVKALQRALGISADGVYGPQTRRAIKRFQRRNGLWSTASPARRRSRRSASRPRRARARRAPAPDLRRARRGSRSASPAATRPRSRPTGATAASTSSPARRGRPWAARATRRRRRRPSRTGWRPSCTGRPGPVALAELGV